MKKGISTDHLSPEERRVTQKRGTEPAFSGKYLSHKEKGVYTCVVCGAPLFNSESKYDSGTGWPSFHSTASENVVLEQEDTSHGMQRTETVCANCGAHLGHVFEDGPVKLSGRKKGSRRRYCINSTALKFKKDSKSQ